MTATVMVVDDEPDIVYMVKTILRSEGFETLAATSVSEAMDVLATQTPDLILLDLRLSDGEGWQVLAGVREDERLARIPVLVLSAHATPTAAERAIEQGAAGYITKPFAAGSLLSQIRSHLKESEGRLAD